SMHRDPSASPSCGPASPHRVWPINGTQHQQSQQCCSTIALVFHWTNNTHFTLILICQCWHIHTVHTHAQTHTLTQTHTHAHTHMQTYTHARTYAHTHTHTDTHTHTHTHTHTLAHRSDTRRVEKVD